MKKWTKYSLCSLVFLTGFIFLSSSCDQDYKKTEEPITEEPEVLIPEEPEEEEPILPDEQKPLSYYNVYRGNSHSHTIFTWTHGGHRDKPMNKLSEPTEFSPSWNAPAGMDYRDPNSINLDVNAYSNLQGLPDNHFELAIANGYDFYAISDHSQEPPLQPVSVNNRAWKATLNAVDKYNSKPNFVALSGFEYSRNSSANGGDGHINVLNVSEYVSADHGQRGPVPAWPESNWTIPQFLNWVKSAQPHNKDGCVLVGFNHPGLKQYNDWDKIDPELIELISTFEMHSNYKQYRWQAYLRALNKGWKLSPIGVHDNHGFYNIITASQYPPTIVLAPELTAEAITNAMRQRRTFVSWNEKVELRYSVNGHIMGSTLDKPEAFIFHIEIKTLPSKPGERVKRIQILRNHPNGKEDVEIVAEALFDGDKDEVMWEYTVADSTAKYFLVRVHYLNDLQKDGSFKTDPSTLAAPVWTGR